VKKINCLLVLAIALAIGAPTWAQDTKSTAKVEVKVPATQPVVVTAPKVTVTAQPVVAAPVAVAVPELPWWKVLIRYGLELVFTILGLLASVFVTVLMKKYGFENYAAKVNDILLRGTGYAEQKSLQALKLNGKPLASTEKLVLALDFVAEKAKEYKLPDKGKEWWTKKVEGWLGAQNMSNGTATPVTPA